MNNCVPRGGYEPLHKREIDASFRSVRLELARVVTGAISLSPQHKAEKAPRYVTPQPKGYRAVAALALAAGLTVSFNGAKDVSKPAAPYIDTSVDCMPRGFQKVTTPHNPINSIKDISNSIQLKGDLETSDCIDELYNQVASQVNPQFAMDTELGFTTPGVLVLPRVYKPKQ